MLSRLVAALLAVTLSACSAGQLCPPRHAIVKQSAMSCAELNQVAAATVKRMGYNIETYTPAAHGQQGKVSGVRRDDYDASYTITVDLTCTTSDAVADAVSSVGCAAQISFPSDFQSNFQTSMSKKVERVSLTPKDERPGVNIDVEPMRNGDGAVGVPLSKANLMPVKVSIDNNTARVYRLDAGGIELEAQDGKRIAAVSPEVAAQRVGEGGGGNAAAKLQSSALPLGTIDADGKRAGYIYVPRQAYRRAMVKLIDVDADEPEGFSIEF